MIYEVVHYHLEHVSVQEFLDLIFNIFLTISQYALEFLRRDGQQQLHKAATICK